MDAKKTPLLLLIIGWIAVITVPTAFFIFGWRDIDLTCRRPTTGEPPTCQVRESFAMNLYTRQVTAEQATGVSFQIRRGTPTIRPGGGSSAVSTSTFVLSAANGEIPLSRVSSNVDSDAKQELIGKMQGFLDNPNSLEFHHHAKMHSIFGYLGAVGVAGLAFLGLAVAWYYLRRLLGMAKPPEKS